MLTGLSEIIDHNEQSALPLCAHMYTKLQTQWHFRCCHRWLNSPSQTLIHSHYQATDTMTFPLLSQMI